MIDVAAEFAQDVRGKEEGQSRCLPATLVLHQGVPGLSANSDLAQYARPSLVLTSPPYPGVYVLYHRWKLRGRLETPAPFWIAGCLDGKGLAHYTMESRSHRTLDAYFERLREAYGDIVTLATAGTWIVQVVGFNDVTSQLPAYLEVMEQVGLVEVRFADLATYADGRLWRTVPSRRWWVASSSRRKTAPHTAQEVVLFHRKHR